MLTAVKQRKAATDFAEKWEERGYEKGESQVFWLSLLHNVYGVNNPTDFIRFEDKVKIDHTSFIDGRIPSTNVLIEQKSITKDLRKGIRQSDGSLLTPYQQAKRYSAELPYSDRPRWIVISNFKEFHIYDMEKPTHEPEVLLLKNLKDEYYRMNFLIDVDNSNIKKALEISLKAGELVGTLYDALLKEYKNPEDTDTLHSLNVLCVRIVFCLYAEDAGLFGKHGKFHDYLAQYRDAGFRDALINLFKILNQKIKDRDPYLDDNLASFPYVNGGLFADDEIILPRMNDEIIDIILTQASASFDWSNISPTIFGGVFESTLNPETRREGGMHYTSIENIHKVIDPLFMNELNDEFEMIISLKTERIKNKRLKEFQEKLASLKFLDPACGSGNFLTETYISIRRLENKIVGELHPSQPFFGDTSDFSPIKVSISQFHGIEINDFAVTVAKTALWIAESQMMKETEDIISASLEYFPIDSDANIFEGNALRINWEDVISKRELSYIIGNPPFVGARLMDNNQKDDIRHIFGKSWKNIGNLDYVSCWFKKSIDYIKQTKIEVALVATNSIVQGSTVADLWGPLFDEGVYFNFAHRSFRWDSEATMKAHVHCVIVGFGLIERTNKYIYSGQQVRRVDRINAYLVDAPSIFIQSRRKPISNVEPMVFGSMPNDDGNLILSPEEKETLLKKYPYAEKYIRPFVGAYEFINRTVRYCIWLTPNDIKEVLKIKPIMDRLQGVKEHRESSKRKSTVELASVSYLFGEIRQPNTDYLLIPGASSENRKYIPIGYMNPNTIASNAVFIIPDASIAHFAIISSNVHMAWMRTVAGRLKSDYRYSASIVYNNFPFPSITEKTKENLEKTGNEIIAARVMYSNWSLAELYNELTMPPELRKAHQGNDKEVMKAYGFNWREMTESECVVELMKMYRKLTAHKLTES